MSWLGLDIGGANLKAADGLGWARSVPFPLWREPAGLDAALDALVRSAPDAERLAVTMTGELCDSFRTKAEGVRHILAAVDKISRGRDVRVYLVGGRFVSSVEAAASPRHAAASNWHALATFACRFVEGDHGLLLDIGSTTTDIVPVASGRPQTRGLTDTERLCHGELVYAGVGRTPICAVTSWLPWRGKSCPVAAELFATTADAYLLLGDLAEEPEATWTADGRPLTMAHARDRLGRMLCADRTEFDDRDSQAAARHVRTRQASIIEEAVAQATSGGLASPATIIVSGSGEFLARQIAEKVAPFGHVVALSQRLGPAASSCAPAHAVAVLAREASERA